MAKKKPIAFRVKKDVDREAVSKLLNTKFDMCLVRNADFMFDSSVHDRTKKMGIMSLFEPVFSSDSKIIKVEYEKKGQFLNVIVKEGVALVENKGFSKGKLEDLLEPIMVNGVKFWPTFFDGGCNRQYKNVKASDIQKVIDAL